METRRRVLGAEHPDTLFTLSDLAYAYQRQGNYALAETFAQELFPATRHAFGPESPQTLAAQVDLALADLSQGKVGESEPLVRQAVDYYRRVHYDDWQLFRAESILGADLAADKKYAEAEPLLLSGYQGLVARKDKMERNRWYYIDRALNWNVQLYRDWGKRDQAAEWIHKMANFRNESTIAGRQSANSQSPRNSIRSEKALEFIIQSRYWVRSYHWMLLPRTR